MKPEPAKPDDEAIGRLLRVDPLAEMERATGLSYKTGVGAALGVLGLLEKNRRVDEMMQATRDVSWRCSVAEYLGIAAEIGFSAIYEEPFADVRDPEREERFYVLWDPRGLMLEFDTFSGQQTVNGGQFGYNWEPGPEALESRFEYTSSGHGVNVEGRFIWSGYHDCREAVRFSTRRFEQHGRFVLPWVDSPFSWICHYRDHHEHNRLRQEGKVGGMDFTFYYQRTLERWERFPAEVRKVTEVVRTDALRRLSQVPGR